MPQSVWQTVGVPEVTIRGAHRRMHRTFTEATRWAAQNGTSACARAGVVGGA